MIHALPSRVYSERPMRADLANVFILQVNLKSQCDGEVKFSRWESSLPNLQLVSMRGFSYCCVQSETVTVPRSHQFDLRLEFRGATMPEALKSYFKIGLILNGSEVFVRLDGRAPTGNIYVN